MKLKIISHKFVTSKALFLETISFIQKNFKMLSISTDLFIGAHIIRILYMIDANLFRQTTKHVMKRKHWVLAHNYKTQITDFLKDKNLVW